MRLPDYIEENAALAPLTSFGIGGPARLLASPSSAAEAAEALALADGLSLPVLVMGGGSNLLVADSGVRAMVIRPGGDGEFSALERDDGLTWRVGASVPLPSLLSAAARAGAAGLEFLAGVPGSVGGAAAMNAGGGGRGIGECVRSADVLGIDGTRRELTGGDLGFSYRRSAVRGLLALGFTFVFPRLDAPEEVAARMREHRERKRATQPIGLRSAGCVFKNPDGDSAGRLLDEAGCKGMREGGAEVSGLHANFIVNRGGARSEDVLRLAARMRDAVFRMAGVALETEILVWGGSDISGRQCGVV